MYHTLLWSRTAWALIRVLRKEVGQKRSIKFIGCNFFAYSWKLPAYSWAFFANSCVWELFCLQIELFYLQFKLFCLQLSFFAYNGKVCLRSTSMDCKQRRSSNCKQKDFPNLYVWSPSLLCFGHFSFATWRIVPMKECEDPALASSPVSHRWASQPGYHARRLPRKHCMLRDHEPQCTHVTC